tara:strand:+ start:971 stop:1240 length:270 start_codon:yes stop_codon:yes gene_type:complete
MAKTHGQDYPAGWLIDPNNKWAIHFDCKTNSNTQFGEDCTIDMWGVDQYGKPMTFKSRRKATKKDSLKTWKQLIDSNWTEFDFGKVKSA